MNERIDILKRTFHEFMNVPFPDDSFDPYLSELHAELAQYDGFMAAQIKNVVSGSRVLKSELATDETLRKRLCEFLTTTSGEARHEAMIYLEYLDRLEKLVAIARNAAK
ncbi:MAG: hypothetical protein AB7Q37_14885 [Pyrinomonadaceae bacterium]